MDGKLQVTFALGLARHEKTVNVVRFSPDGALHGPLPGVPGRIVSFWARCPRGPRGVAVRGRDQATICRSLSWRQTAHARAVPQATRWRPLATVRFPGPGCFSAAVGCATPAAAVQAPCRRRPASPRLIPCPCAADRVILLWRPEPSRVSHWGQVKDERDLQITRLTCEAWRRPIDRRSAPPTHSPLYPPPQWS